MSDYWISGASSGTGGDRRIHPKRDCSMLKQSNSIRPVSDVEVDEFASCKVCTGDVPMGEMDLSVYQAAVEWSGDLEDKDQ